jgi:hypothetical protein
MPRLLPAVLAPLAVVAASPEAVAIHGKSLEIHWRDGFYFGLGLGYASVSGTRGVPIENHEVCPEFRGNAPFLWAEPVGGGVQCIYAGGNGATVSPEEQFAEVVRTDFGSGLAFELRFGWNVLGYASPELSVSGHGGLEGKEGMAHVTGRLRIHPIQFWIPMEERPYDATVYGGFGLPSFGGYHPDEFIQGNDDGKGWQGIHYDTGLSFHWMVARVVSLGLDVRFLFPRYLTWIVNFDDDVQSLPKETPSTTVVLTTLQLMALF